MVKEMTVYAAGGKGLNARIDGIEIQTGQGGASEGEGSLPNPFQLFLASLGTCAGVYVFNFCRAREIPTEGIELKTRFHFDPLKELCTAVEIEIQLNDTFPEKYKKAVVRAANLCTVKRHLMDPPEVSVSARIK